MGKPRVLSIDDSKSVHAFLKLCLVDKVSSFDVVFNGKEGVERLRRGPNDFDVIFLDWEMPELDGPATFFELKKIGVTTPVFMLTSKNDPADMEKMLDAGVADYILKPYTPDIIQFKLRSILAA